MNRAVLFAVFAAVLTGCVSAPKGPATRQEWEAIHQREFAGKNPREVQDAAEKVLRLVDHDFTFQYPEGQLVGRRPWMIYLAIAISSGTDYWTISTQETEAGTRAVVQATRDSSTIAPSPVVGGPGAAVMSTATPGQPVVVKEPYDLFWSRMEYMLGLRSEWDDCGTARANVSAEGGRKGYLDTLCAFNTDDRHPDEGPLERR